MSYESKFLKSIEDDIVTLKSLQLSLYHIYLKGYTLWLVDKWTFFHRIVWVDRESNKEMGLFIQNNRAPRAIPSNFYYLLYFNSFKSNIVLVLNTFWQWNISNI